MAGSRLYALCVNIPEHSPNGLYDFTSYPWRDREGTYTTPWYLNIVDICCNAGCISPNLWLEPFSSSIPNYKILIHGFHLIPAEIILWMDGWRKTTPNSNRRILHIYSSRGIRFPISGLPFRGVHLSRASLICFTETGRRSCAMFSIVPQILGNHTLQVGWCRCLPTMEK